MHGSMDGEEDGVIGERGGEGKRTPKKKDRKNWKKRVSQGGKHNSTIASSPPFRTKGEEEEKTGGGGLSDLLGGGGKQKSSFQQISPSFSRWSTHHHHPTIPSSTIDERCSIDSADSPSQVEKKDGGETELVDMLVEDVFKHLSFDPKTVVSSPQGEALRRVCFACLSDRPSFEMRGCGKRGWGRPFSFSSSSSTSSFSSSASGSSGLPLPSPSCPPSSGPSVIVAGVIPGVSTSSGSPSPSLISPSSLTSSPSPNTVALNQSSSSISSNPPSLFSSSFSPASSFSWNSTNYPSFASGSPQVSTMERERELEKEREREKRDLPPSKRLFARENMKQYQTIFEKPIPLISRALALSVDSTGFSFHDIQVRERETISQGGKEKWDFYF